MEIYLVVLAIFVSAVILFLLTYFFISTQRHKYNILSSTNTDTMTDLETYIDKAKVMIGRSWASYDVIVNIAFSLKKLEAENLKIIALKNIENVAALKQQEFDINTKAIRSYYLKKLSSITFRYAPYIYINFKIISYKHINYVSHIKPY